MNLLLLVLIVATPPTGEELDAAADQQLAWARTLPERARLHVVAEMAAKGRVTGRLFIARALRTDRWIIPQLNQMLHEEDFHDVALTTLWETFPEDVVEATIPHLRHAAADCPSRLEMGLNLSRAGFGDDPRVAPFLEELCVSFVRDDAWGTYSRPSTVLYPAPENELREMAARLKKKRTGPCYDPPRDGGPVCNHKRNYPEVMLVCPGSMAFLHGVMVGDIVWRMDGRAPWAHDEYQPRGDDWSLTLLRDGREVIIDHKSEFPQERVCEVAARYRRLLKLKPNSPHATYWRSVTESPHLPECR